MFSKHDVTLNSIVNERKEFPNDKIGSSLFTIVVWAYNNSVVLHIETEIGGLPMIIFFIRKDIISWMHFLNSHFLVFKVSYKRRSVTVFLHVEFRSYLNFFFNKNAYHNISNNLISF